MPKGEYRNGIFRKSIKNTGNRIRYGIMREIYKKEAATKPRSQTVGLRGALMSCVMNSGFSIDSGIESFRQGDGKNVEIRIILKWLYEGEVISRTDYIFRLLKAGYSIDVVCTELELDGEKTKLLTKWYNNGGFNLEDRSGNETETGSATASKEKDDER